MKSWNGTAAFATASCGSIFSSIIGLTAVSHAVSNVGVIMNPVMKSAREIKMMFEGDWFVPKA